MDLIGRIVTIILVLFVVFTLARCIVIVQQSKAYVLERLGAFRAV